MLETPVPIRLLEVKPHLVINGFERVISLSGEIAKFYKTFSHRSFNYCRNKVT